MIRNRLRNNRKSVARKFFVLALSIVCLWMATTQSAQAGASTSPQSLINTTVPIIGIVAAAPSTVDGYGEWQVVDGNMVFPLLAGPGFTLFLSTVPQVGDTVYVEAKLSEQVYEVVSILTVNPDPAPLPVQENLVYATIFGSMLTEPPSENGIGRWEVLAKSGQIYRVNVYDVGAFAQGIPGQGDDVYVAGWRMQTDEVSADTVAINDGSIESNDLPEQSVFALSGEIIGGAADTAGEQWWTVRDGANIYRVRSDSQTVFTPGQPQLGTYVHLLAVEQLADESLLVLEMSEDTFTAGELVVRLQPAVAATTIAERYELIPESTALAIVNIYRFKSPNPTIRYLAMLLNQLQVDPDVLWAELNFKGELPIEGHPHRLWGWGGIDLPSYGDQRAFEQIQIGNVHNVYRGAAQIVAVLDTGVDLHHWDLEEHLLAGRDLVDHDAQPADIGPGAAQGHGTHISGIIARVAPDSQILPVRVLDPDGRGDVFVVATAIVWAVQQGADVINLSQGTDANSHVLHDVIRWAVEQGVSVVAAAGNSDSSALHYPAAYGDVLAVTAIDSNHRKAPFANYGTWVDLAAPGVGITSTIVTAQGSGYAAWSGTSMATPFVSAAVALLRQKFPEASVIELNQWLQSSGAEIDAQNAQYLGLIGTSLDVKATLHVVALYIPLVIRE